MKDQFFLENNVEVLYIRSKEQLTKYIDNLNSASQIGVDLEFDRERFTYGSNICLIQLFVGDKCLLIDATGETFYHLIFPALENASIQKIMHSPSEDLTLLHELNCFPVNIFDTEKAARLIDVKAFSLANLLTEFIGVTIDKSQQKTNWTISPISSEQMRYAAKDVIFLPRLRELLLSKIQHLGIEHWLNEENKFWDTFRVEKKEEGQLTNKDDAKKLPPFQLFVLNELLKVRDKYAKKYNKPGFYIVSKEKLTDGVFDEQVFMQWKNQKGILLNIQNDSVQNEFLETLKIAKQKAESLKLKKRKEGSFLPLEERIELSKKRKEFDNLVNEKYRPVHDEIAKKHGENTAMFIFNEKTMLELATQKLNINDLPFQYRKELVKSILIEKGILVE
jgi:ribonuclease D